MPNFGPRLLRRPPLSGRYRLGALLAAFIGLFAAAYFYQVASPQMPRPVLNPTGEISIPVGTPPLIRFLLGGDLWCLFDPSLQDNFGRPFPQFSISFLSSRSTLEKCPTPYSREILLIMPAEKFLADELERHESTDPELSVQRGPDICQTHLALLMSPKTHDALMSISATPLSTLADWLRACEATSGGPAPVLFTMADPRTCSSSWMGLAEMMADKLPADGRLADVPTNVLATDIADLRRKVSVQGNSDRVEMYRYLLDGCPDNRVLLVYSHLADEITATGAFSGYTVVVPQLHFQPVVRALIVTQRNSHLDAATLLPPLLTQFQRSLLPGMNLPPHSQNGAPPIANPVPDYTTMSRLLKQWSGTNTAPAGE
jgi:hypothetical protein